MQKTEKETILEQLDVLQGIIPAIDGIYSKLTQTFKMMSPILKKKMFNSDDQSVLKDFLHNVHKSLEEFGQLLKRGEGEKDLLRSEVLRLKAASPKVQEDFAIAEAELWAVEQNLVVREKALNHLSELIQLLDSVMRVGEMTEFDERLLTEILTDLKNLAG
jgi:hypothetical protein